MDKQSLIKLRNILGEFISQQEQIKQIDRTEAMLNIYHFLDPEEYDGNIKVLQKKRNIEKEEKQYGRK